MRRPRHENERNGLNQVGPDELRKARLAVRTEAAGPPESQTSLQALLERSRTLTPAGFELPATPLQAQISMSPLATTRTVYMTVAALSNLSVTFDSQFQDRPADHIGEKARGHRADDQRDP